MKSNEDMILALAGQFKQLSHEPEKLGCTRLSHGGHASPKKTLRCL